MCQTLRSIIVTEIENRMEGGSNFKVRGNTVSRNEKSILVIQFLFKRIVNEIRTKGKRGSRFTTVYSHFIKFLILLCPTLSYVVAADASLFSSKVHGPKVGQH